MKQNNMKRESKLLIFCASICVTTGVFATVPTAFLADQTGDSWGYVVTDDGVAIVERSGADSDMQLVSGAYYRRELKIPTTIDSRPVVSIDLEHRELVDCRQERYSFMTIPSSVTNITGVLDRNDPNCEHRVRGAMFSVEGFRFLGDVPAFPELDANQSDTLPFSTASKIFVPREFATSWGTFLTQFGMSIAGYVNEDTDSIGVTMRTRIGEKVWTYRVSADNTATLCRWDEVSDARTDVTGVMHLCRSVTDEYDQWRFSYGIWSEAAVMPMTNSVLSIPLQLDGHLVKSIGDNALRDYDLLEEIVVQDITEIGRGAFAHCPKIRAFDLSSTCVIGDTAFASCTNLQGVSFSSNLVSIGRYAFSGCKSLTNALFQVQSGQNIAIGDGAFASCKRLTELHLPLSIARIGNHAFSCCEALTNLVIDSEAEIGNCAFSGCVSLSKLELGESFTHIGDDAFADCWKLEVLSLPASVTNIGRCAFARCSSLSVVAINGRAAVGAFAFQDCSALSTVEWKQGGLTLGCGAFLDDRSLRHVEVPDGVEKLEELTFDGCSALTTVVFPQSMTIANPAFFGCKKLSGVYFRGDVPSADDSLFEGGSEYAVVYVNASGNISGTWKGKPVVSWQNVACAPDWQVVLFDLRSYGENVSAVSLCQRVTNVCDLVEPSVRLNLNGQFLGWRISYSHADEATRLYATYSDAEGMELAEYYVSESGSDSNNGLSRAQAFRTIGKALNVATDDSLVLVAPGEYPCVNYAPNGKHVEVRSERGCGATVITGGLTNRCVSIFSDEIPDADVEERETTVVFDGFTIRDGLVRDDPEFENFGAGAKGGVYVNCIISNCSVQANSGEDQLWGGGAFGATLVNTVIARNALIDLNDIRPTVSDACNGAGAADCDMFNCTVTENEIVSAESPLQDAARDRQLAYCRAYNTIIGPNTASAKHSVGSSLRSCCVGDAQFLMNSDSPFRLSVLSPCVDAGDNQFVISARTIENEARVVGRSVDIGAYEVQLNELFEVSERNEDELEIVRVVAPNVTSVDVPASIGGKTVTSVGAGAFEGCAALAELTIPDTVTNIGAYAFIGCTNLQRLVIGSGVVSVPNHELVFGYWDEENQCEVAGCDSLRELVLGSPEVVAAFCTDYYDSELMREVRITYPNVTNVVLNGRFTALPESYFLGRFPSLRTVTLPDGIDNIPAGAFEGCAALAELTIPDTVTNIGAYAFIGCTNLQRLVIGSGVVSVPNHELVFGYWDEENQCEVAGCDSLRELVLGSPEVVAAFCTDYYDSEFMREVRITYPNVTNVVLNGRFTALPESYFLGRFPSLQTVTLPDGIDNIPAGAFEGCAALAELTIPDTVTNIGAYAFIGCTNLQRLVIGSGVVSVPNHELVFGYWDAENEREIGGLPSLLYVEIRSEMGIRALVPDFFEGNYPSVTDMVIAETIVSVSPQFFDYFPNLENLQAASGVGPITEHNGRSYVNGYWWNYRVAGGWVEVYEVESPYGDIVVPDEINGNPVVSLTDYSMSGVRNVILGKNVRSVGAEAFGTPGTNGAKVSVADGNEYLVMTNGLLCDTSVTHVYFCEDDVTNLVIPETIQSFALNVCFQHSNLKSVVFPEGMSCINGAQVFMHSGLENVTFSSTMISLGDTAFDWCDQLQHIALPTSLEFVNPQSFCNSGLRELDIPDSVTNIGYNAFCNCYDLTNVTFGATVSEVGIAAFRSCTNLMQISFRGNAPNICSAAFENVPKSCKVFVEKGSTGWGTGIPGIWNGMSIYWVGENPSEASIPDLGSSPDKDTVAGALSDVEDANIRSNIDDSNYADFRMWAGTVKTKGANSAAGFTSVQSSPNAWLSYALGSETLIENAPTNGQMKVEKFEPTATSGSFDFTVSIDDIPVGDDATPSNLAKVFGIEGGTSPDSSSLSSANVNITFGTPENGKVKFTAGPKNANEGSFFMRVKMTP